MGFPIRIIQVDNGYEIVNDDDRTDKESAFEKAAKALNIELRRTRPYSPWQNGKVERSHREDGKILYWRKIFTSERELIRKVAKHEARYNKTAKTSLNFKNPNQLVSEYFSKCNICLDTLSRGGVYYHYKNKVEILHDLMREGMAYRVDKINEVLAEYSGELDANAVAHMIVDKVLDESELMSVYAIYLQATKNNDDLKNLFPILVEESLKATYIGVKVAKKDGCEYLTNDFLIFFMNTVILGCEILDGARDSFINNREFFIEIIKLFIDSYEKGKIR